MYLPKLTFQVFLFCFSFSVLMASVYEGHYKVIQPQHEIDFDKQFDKQNQHDKGSRIEIRLSEEERKKQELERKRKAEELKRKKQLEKEELERSIRLLEIRKIETENERKKMEIEILEEKRRSFLVNKSRENMMFSVQTKEHFAKLVGVRKSYPKDKEYELEKNESSYPVDRTRVITNDRYVVGLLENSIDTQLSGRAIIVVEENIFGAEGRKILFPKGTRLVCQYQSLEEYGQTRVPIECLRVLRPDGVSITLTNAYVGDQMGRTGAIGQVDNRNWEKYGHAMTLAAINGLSSYGSFMLSMSDNKNLVPASPIINNASSTLSDITSKILDKNLNIPPIVNISKGSRVILMPLTDIFIKEIGIIKTKSKGE